MEKDSSGLVELTQSVQPLVEYFNSGPAKTRFLALLSPT